VLLDGVHLARHVLFRARLDVGLVAERIDRLAHALAGVSYFVADRVRVLAHCTSSFTESIARSGTGGAASRICLRPVRAKAAAMAANATVTTSTASHVVIARSRRATRHAVNAPAARRPYRHFPTREALSTALAEPAGDDDAAAREQPFGRVQPLPYLAPGRLGRVQPLALEVTHVLDEVPPHLIADQLIAEARRAAGVAVALYIVDIDGSQLIRLAGSEDFPETLEAPPALGPEIVPERLPPFYEVAATGSISLRTATERGWRSPTPPARGPTAAGLAAAALGALRAARRSGKDLVQAAVSIDDVVRALGNPSFVVTALLARWHAPTATLAWINCGHPPAYVIDREGRLTELEGPVHPALGAGGEHSSFEVASVILEPGERLVLCTDGVTERVVKGGGRFGVDGMRRAIQGADAPTAAATAMAIQHSVMSGATDPHQDDATLVVLTVD
jgi:stage II sporulation SpoE-like protein